MHPGKLCNVISRASSLWRHRTMHRTP
jgi:hypothetical protein